MKRVLVLGGTGAMGVYLVPQLLEMGYTVDVVSLDECVSEDPALHYITGNAKDLAFLEKLLARGYHGIVDFLIYHTEEFRERYAMFLSHTEHYIYLSSYRIYADASPITETSPRLLDVSDNQAFLATEDYSLFKARGEDILHASGADNYTIIRPAITFSKTRFQLVTLEAECLVRRMREGRTVYLPEAALGVEGTMSWAGDVARMISRLLFAPHARKETYTLATAEHHPWRDIAAYYAEIGGLRWRGIPTDDFLRIASGGGEIYDGPRYQLLYDRLYNRVVDNRKILDATGMKQSDLMPVKEGLRRELAALPNAHRFADSAVYNAMDEYDRQLQKR